MGGVGGLVIAYFAKIKLALPSALLREYLFFLLFNKLFKPRTKNTTLICIDIINDHNNNKLNLALNLQE